MKCTLSGQAGIGCRRRSRTSAVLVLGMGLLCASAHVSGQAPGQEPAGAPALKVTSNLVIVRVVVSDASGHVVGGLHESDFKIFDRGKEQSIAHFEVEAPTPVDPSAVTVPSQEQSSNLPASEASVGASSNLSKNFVALYFDNLSATNVQLAAGRIGAEQYLSSALKPNDRVAVFSSEQQLADFTDDRQELVAAVRKVHTSARVRAGELDCPHLSDYQALQITELSEQPHADAWILARDEMARCKIPDGASQGAQNSSSSGSKSGGKGGARETANAAFDRDLDVAQILNLARTIVLQNQNLVRDNLQQLDRVVQRLSQMPGRRNVILVSPGFLMQTEQLQLDRIIDHALRSQVVIDSLDPKGLANLQRSADASLGYSPTNGDAMRASRAVDSNREAVATGVLAEVAEGTGGKYVHNTNDLQAGFAGLERSGAYILAFAPAELKADGSYHTLKVTLGGESKGFTIQARRGYFAPKGDAPVAGSATGSTESAGDAAARAQHDQIQQQVLSKVDVTQLPVSLRNSIAEQPDKTQILSVSAHLDTRALQFQQEADHSVNAITFVVAVFDGKDKVIEAQQRHVRINALDSQLPILFTRGLEATFAFKLGAGTYRVRAVVADSVQHLVGVKSDSVTVP
jgi:VWFA-related protein